MAGDQQLQAKRPRMCDDLSKVCCTSEQSHQVLCDINEQRHKGFFCDVVLIVDGVRFPAHRNILAASSSYFSSMFTLGMRESYQNEVELVDTSSIGCKAVLDFLYGSEVFLDSISIDSVLKAAHLLQIWKLVDMCCEHLGRMLDTENYLQLRELASIYSLELLDSSIDRFILKNFGMLSFTPGFIEKVPVEKLCFYLDSEKVQVNVEYDLLKAALKWLNHGPERTKEADRVLQMIRFSLIPKKDLIELVNPVLGFLTLEQQKNCQSYIDEAIHYHTNVTAQPVLQNRRSTLRADGEQLLIFGGEYCAQILMENKNGIRFFDPERGEWISETHLPVSLGEFCVAVLGNYIFCAGGYAVERARRNTSNMVYRYDPRWKQWRKVAPMNHDRAGFYLAALEDRLVSVGGISSRQEIGGSVEMYNPRTDTWSFVADLPRPTCNHAGAVYQQRIYISGGKRQQYGMASKTLRCYDYCTDLWDENLSMMSADRCSHSMCTLNEHIYAIGGTDGVNGAAHQSVECYSPLCDQWTTVAPLLRKTTYPAAAAVWRGEMYVLGGTTHMYGVSQQKVQVYDRKMNKWFEGTCQPLYLNSVKACVCVLKQLDANANVKRKCC